MWLHSLTEMDQELGPVLALSSPVWVGGSLRVQLPALNLRPSSANPAQRTGTGPSAHTDGPEEETQVCVFADI